jgi:medium-chain acyl-[acyl-carrier-protein] hydrolase
VKRQLSGSPLLNYHRRDNAELRLFCFPYAGGPAAIFREWADNLANSFDIWSVEYPGRGTRRSEAPLRRISLLVDGLLPELRSDLTGSYAFFGHSMGALVAFEILRRLKSEGAATAVCFFASGCRAPTVGFKRRSIYGLPEPELIEELRRIGGTPDAVLSNEDLMQLALPALRADFEASERYTYKSGPRLDCPIFVYSGLYDSIVSPEDLTGWRAESTESSMIRMFPGAHFFLHSAREMVMRVLTRDLLVQLERTRTTKVG